MFDLIIFEEKKQLANWIKFESFLQIYLQIGFHLIPNEYTRQFFGVYESMQMNLSPSQAWEMDDEKKKLLLNASNKLYQFQD